MKVSFKNSLLADIHPNGVRDDSLLLQYNSTRIRHYFSLYRGHFGHIHVPLSLMGSISSDCTYETVSTWTLVNDYSTEAERESSVRLGQYNCRCLVNKEIITRNEKFKGQSLDVVQGVGGWRFNYVLLPTRQQWRIQFLQVVISSHFYSLLSRFVRFRFSCF